MHENRTSNSITVGGRPQGRIIRTEGLAKEKREEDVKDGRVVVVGLKPPRGALAPPGGGFSPPGGGFSPPGGL